MFQVRWPAFVIYTSGSISLQAIPLYLSFTLNGAGLMAACGITVGCNCILGSTVIVDTDFHSIDPDRHTNPDAKVRYAPITIGNNVWLAGQTVVLKGVTIGENSVVGFRGVVTSNVPPNVIVAGNPVRVVKQPGA